MPTLTKFGEVWAFFVKYYYDPPNTQSEVSIRAKLSPTAELIKLNWANAMKIKWQKGKLLPQDDESVTAVRQSVFLDPRYVVQIKATLPRVVDKMTALQSKSGGGKAKEKKLKEYDEQHDLLNGILIARKRYLKGGLEPIAPRGHRPSIMCPQSENG